MKRLHQQSRREFLSLFGRLSLSLPFVSIQQAQVTKNQATQPWSSIFDDSIEVSTTATITSGQLPEGFIGTLYRNGPGFRKFANTFFDGDGMIRALRFLPDGSIQYDARFVHTPKYLKEKDSDRKLYRTVGTNRSRGNFARIPYNEVNTSVMLFNDRLLAMEEGGHPWQLNTDLSTVGAFNFDGQLAANLAFSAHPHIDPKTKEIFTFGMKMGPKMGIQTFKITPAQKIVPLGFFPFTKGCFVHDFSISENWMIFVVGPLSWQLGKSFLGVTSLLESMTWHEDWGTEIFLLSKDGQRMIQLETQSCLAGHTVSAREQDGEILVDLFIADGADVFHDVLNYRTCSFSSFASNRLVRFRIDPNSQQVHRELLTDIPADFPRINEQFETKKSKWVYATGNPPEDPAGLFRGITKINRDTGDYQFFDFGKGNVAQEPVFISNGLSEDDGWVINFVHDSQRQATDVTLFDARSITDGPICTMELPVNAGMTFHGCWSKT